MTPTGLIILLELDKVAHEVAHQSGDSKGPKFKSILV